MTTATARPADELRDFLADEMPRHRERWGEDDGFEARLDWQRRLAAGGWAAPSWPAEHGGRDLGPVGRVACDRELTAVGAPMCAGVLGLQNVGPALMMFGTPDQQRSLPRILDGTQIWAQGFSEPGSGSDLAGLQTRAELVGDHFVVNGQKVWTSNALEATHALLLVRTDRAAPKHRGISALLVDLTTPGIERRPLRQLTGESGFGEMFFSDVHVPVENLLGEINQGWEVTTRTLGYERTGVINLAIGLEHEVQETVREAAGWASADRDAMLRCWVQARVVALMAARSLAELGAGKRPGAEQSIIKFAWSQATSRFGECVLDAQGSEGLLSSTPATARFLSTRSSTIAAGTTEVLANVLAERVLGLPRDPADTAR